MTSIARMEEGKATYVGRCFSSVAFPLRQQRRISNLVPRVAVISQSEGGDVGPAASQDTGRRATLCVQPAARLVAVSPWLDPRGDALRIPRAVDWRRRAPFQSPGLNLPAEVLGGRVERVGSDVTAIFPLFLTKRDQLGGAA